MIKHDQFWFLMNRSTICKQAISSGFTAATQQPGVHRTDSNPNPARVWTLWRLSSPWNGLASNFFVAHGTDAPKGEMENHRTLCGMGTAKNRLL